MTKVTNPNDWIVLDCVCRRARISIDVPHFCEQSQPGGGERRLACPKNGIGPPSLRAGIVQMAAALQPRAGCVFLERKPPPGPRRRSCRTRV